MAGLAVLLLLLPAGWLLPLPGAVRAVVPGLMLGAALWALWALWWLAQALAETSQQHRGLARREAQMRKLADNLPDTVVRIDRQGRHLYANAAVRVATGLAPEAFIGRTTAELGMPPELVCVWDALLARVFGGAPTERLQFDFPGPQGQRTWESLVVPEVDAHGKVYSVLVISRDITERRRLLDALRTSERRLAHLLDHTPAVIYSVRHPTQGAASFCSANVELLLGHRPQDFQTDAGFWQAHVHPDDLAAVAAAMSGVQAGDGATVVEYRFRHRDGRWRWLRDEFRLVRGEGNVLERVGSCIDISERREAEAEVRRLAVELEQRVAERTEQLQASELRYRRIFEAVPVAIQEQDWSGARRVLNALRDEGVSDPAAYLARHPEVVRECLRAVRVLKVNRKAAELRDLGLHDGQPRTLEPMFDTPEGMSDFIGELLALWRGERQHIWQRRQTLPDGRPRKLLLSMSLPALDDSSDGTALVCFIDISEIDRLNAQLDATVGHIRRVNRELETFTYSVSHDLKAPLRGIDGYGRLLQRDHAQQLDEEGRQFLGHIRQATQHMGQLIDDLLAYSRLERRSVALGTVALAPLAQAVIQALHEAVAERGASITLNLPDGLQAQADGQGLEIALRNLIDNALKFGRQGVPLTIELGGEQRPDGGVALWVRDNGIGFDMRFQERIFEIFQRLHRAEDYPGTGVGLAIVRKAMERMGGTASAHGQPGAGAVFRLELPGSR
ncbi:PAS domain-containing sensor histidine kinase [Aquabacterium sp. OR-4]|uniref:PAS domain-containing sensor histidine kinase n=1 Tax=Aquabacterium sp. OR-4 TaxID=2978127 RepID=UPI0021B23E31|nr:PAS domain S-box protein [Aquabacterium sp. OR-4]MDT7834588.1 PAS domain S-box protein [Aquabacterium sp. OR-4]